MVREDEWFQKTWFLRGNGWKKIKYERFEFYKLLWGQKCQALTWQRYWLNLRGSKVERSYWKEKIGWRGQSQEISWRKGSRRSQSIEGWIGKVSCSRRSKEGPGRSWRIGKIETSCHCIESSGRSSCCRSQSQGRGGIEIGKGRGGVETGKGKGGRRKIECCWWTRMKLLKWKELKYYWRNLIV